MVDKESDLCFKRCLQQLQFGPFSHGFIFYLIPSWFIFCCFQGPLFTHKHTHQPLISQGWDRSAPRNLKARSPFNNPREQSVGKESSELKNVSDLDIFTANYNPSCKRLKWISAFSSHQGLKWATSEHVPSLKKATFVSFVFSTPAGLVNVISLDVELRKNPRARSGKLPLGKTSWNGEAGGRSSSTGPKGRDWAKGKLPPIFASPSHNTTIVPGVPAWTGDKWNVGQGADQRSMCSFMTVLQFLQN